MKYKVTETREKNNLFISMTNILSKRGCIKKKVILGSLLKDYFSEVSLLDKIEEKNLDKLWKFMKRSRPSDLHLITLVGEGVVKEPLNYLMSLYGEDSIRSMVEARVLKSWTSGGFASKVEDFSTTGRLIIEYSPDGEKLEIYPASGYMRIDESDNWVDASNFKETRGLYSPSPVLLKFNHELQEYE